MDAFQRKRLEHLRRAGLVTNKFSLKGRYVSAQWHQLDDSPETRANPIEADPGVTKSSRNFFKKLPVSVLRFVIDLVKLVVLPLNYFVTWIRSLKNPAFDPVASYEYLFSLIEFFSERSVRDAVRGDTEERFRSNYRLNHYDATSALISEVFASLRSAIGRHLRNLFKFAYRLIQQ